MAGGLRGHREQATLQVLIFCKLQWKVGPPYRTPLQSGMLPASPPPQSARVPQAAFHFLLLP